MADEVIIEVALNGMSSPAFNRNVPLLPADIARDAIVCLEAGASIIHNHIDALLHSQAAADRYAEGWADVFAAFPEAVVCSTSTAAPTIEEKWRHIALLADRGMTMGVWDPGSVNLWGTTPDGLPQPNAKVYANPPAELAYAMAVLRDARLGPSIAIYEPGFLRTMLAYERAGALAGGAQAKLYFGGRYNWFDGAPTGSCFGLPPTQAALDAYLEMMAGSRVPWAVAVIGGDVVETGLARLALERGGHIRIGLEDHRGPDQPSNAELLEAALDLARQVGREVASPARTREILGLRAPSFPAANSL